MYVIVSVLVRRAVFTANGVVGFLAARVGLVQNAFFQKNIQRAVKGDAVGIGEFFLYFGVGYGGAVGLDDIE